MFPSKAAVTALMDPERILSRRQSTPFRRILQQSKQSLTGGLRMAQMFRYSVPPGFVRWSHVSLVVARLDSAWNTTMEKGGISRGAISTIQPSGFTAVETREVAACAVLRTARERSVSSTATPTWARATCAGTAATQRSRWGCTTALDARTHTATRISSRATNGSARKNTRRRARTTTTKRRQRMLRKPHTRIMSRRQMRMASASATSSAVRAACMSTSAVSTSRNTSEWLRIRLNEVVKTPRNTSEWDVFGAQCA
mmetsp:Transcript_21510/g.51024  ORF Transcript_21510/g.51024 Transcript_21510/m.51024 type:complete len:256 (+) Transcript_21510:523-1290(+)